MTNSNQTPSPLFKVGDKVLYNRFTMTVNTVNANSDGTFSYDLRSGNQYFPGLIPEHSISLLKPVKPIEPKTNTLSSDVYFRPKNTPKDDWYVERFPDSQRRHNF